MTEKVKITIDEKEIEVPAGIKVIEAAKQAGINVPHFCYHPGLKVVGQCRMCFVEIEGARKLATACSTPVNEGMVVRTKSQEVIDGQNSTLEFTLLNHPLDCPICDRGGECKLQDYTFEHGPPRSRMSDAKSLKIKHHPISDQIVLDQERCILCTRCVRFSSEVDGGAELVVNQRGHESVIDVFEGKSFDSDFSGNVVDLCPVGALTAQDFRFQARPWELKKHDALCTGCSVGCNVELHTKHRHPGIARPDKKDPQPQIVRVVPRENLNINEWWMCDRGRWGYHFHNQDDKRITSTLSKSSDGQWTSCSLKTVQESLRHNPAANWSFWISEDCPNEIISWAKEIRQSWIDRGQSIGPFNHTPFGDAFMSFWAERLNSNPWALGQCDWNGINEIYSDLNCSELKKINPILGLKVEQKVRDGKLSWKEIDWKQLPTNFDSACVIVGAPTKQSALDQLKKLPSDTRLLIAFKHFNARGLLNEGIVPLEVLQEDLENIQLSQYIFAFSQSTQDSARKYWKNCFSQSEFLVLADSYLSEISQEADVVLPLAPLYESEFHATSVENYTQFSDGVTLHHPNVESIKRGSQIVPPSLKLAMGPQK